MDWFEFPMTEKNHTTGQNLQKDFLPPQAEKRALEDGGLRWLDGGSSERFGQTEMETRLPWTVFSGLSNEHHSGG
jgi:hypothetical protein